DAVGRDAGVAAALFGGLPHPLPRLALGLAAVEEAQVFRPRHVEEDAEVVLRREFEEPVGWGVVRPEGVDPGVPHPAEVLGCPLGRGEGLAPGVRGERAVGDSLQPHPPRAAGEQLARDTDSFLRSDCDVAPTDALVLYWACGSTRGSHVRPSGLSGWP